MKLTTNNTPYKENRRGEDEGNWFKYLNIIPKTRTWVPIFVWEVTPQRRNKRMGWFRQERKTTKPLLLSQHSYHCRQLELISLGILRKRLNAIMNCSSRMEVGIDPTTSIPDGRELLLGSNSSSFLGCPLPGMNRSPQLQRKPWAGKQRNPWSQTQHAKESSTRGTTQNNCN